MKLRHLFMVNILIAIFFGGSCTFFPHFVYSLYNVVPDEAAIWAARLTGGSIVGFATLMWFGIKAASSESRRAIAIALLVQDIIGFAASIIFQVKEDVNAFGWFSLALYGTLAFAYAYFIFISLDKDSKV